MALGSARKRPEPTNQDGLKQIYNRYFATHTSLTPQDKKELVSKAKRFYFKRQYGELVDMDEYQSWVLENNLEEKKEEDPAMAIKKLTYNELAELILSGKEIPGIRDIPDVVLENEGSTLVLKERKKPWEVEVEAGAEGGAGDTNETILR